MKKVLLPWGLALIFCFRRELFQSNVSVHTIEPGGFDTGITDMGKLGQAMKKAYERAPEELKAVYGGNVSRWCKFSPSDKSASWKTIFFISHPKHMLWVQ